MFHVKQLDSDEMDALRRYTELLLKWNRKINLVSESTIEDLEDRHIQDCLQLASFITADQSVVDLGSGAGLPGIVLSIILDYPITLIEADQRKCIFLREVKRKLNLTCDIIEDRVENISGKSFDVIISRAMASIKDLLELSENIRKQKSKMILLKGKTYQQEIDEAKHSNWDFEICVYESKTSCTGVILEIKNIRKN